MRMRHLFILIGSLIVLAGLFITDPDGGRATSIWLLSLGSGVLAVGFAHYGRKALHDYPEANFQRLLGKASEHPIGAGLACIALAIVFQALTGLFHVAHAQDVRTFVPPAAAQHLPTLRADIDQAWPDHPLREVLPALIEHESCISLKHSRCWSATSRLRTAREEGAGMPQITRTFNPDGSVRFDSLAAMRDRHPELRALSWANVYSRPDLQLLTVVLMNRDNFRALATIRSQDDRLAMTDAAYNQGAGAVQRDRRLCQITPGCDPQRWWGHVERTCTASHAALYAGRSACDISRHHVADVLRVRSPKYRGLV
jgi:hypothetical protein